MAPIPSDEITSCGIKIPDFSSAFMVGHEPKYVKNTLLVTPPEALFDENLTISIDLWFLRCTLFEIVGAGRLFWNFGGEDNLIKDMVHVLGPLPGPWWERWEPREKFFTKDGRRVKASKHPHSTPKYRLSCLRRFGTPAKTSEVLKAETASLRALLSVMLVYKPSGRVLSGEALNSDYMKNWAEPALVEAKRPAKAVDSSILRSFDEIDGPKWSIGHKFSKMFRAELFELPLRDILIGFDDRTGFPSFPYPFSNTLVSMPVNTKPKSFILEKLENP